MHRAMSQDSSASGGNGSNPSTPGSTPGSCSGSAEIFGGQGESHKQSLWRESKAQAHAHAQSVDEYSDSFESAPPCEKRLRNATSDGDIVNSASSNNAAVGIATKDVDCSLVQTLHPKTKFDAHEAMVTGLTFKSNGDLVVSDSANQKVKALDVRTGQLKIECSIGCKQGARLGKPRGVTMLKSGQILVTDEEKSDLKLFTKDGRYLARFGRDLTRPRDITHLANGNVLVCDIGSNKIFLYQNLSEKGVVDLTQDVENGGSVKIGQPMGVAVTKDGCKFSISDAKNNTILLVDGHGKLLNTYYQAKLSSGTSCPGSGTSGGVGVQPGLENPTGICQELHANSILIADTGNSRIVRLDLDTMTLTRELTLPSQGEGQDFKVTAPELIAVGPKGLLAVVDEDRSAVKIYKYMD